MDERYHTLANAIIIQAAKDYRSALKRLAKHPYDERASLMKRDAESFFSSGWLRHLTDVDGAFLMQKLRAEVA